MAIDNTPPRLRLIATIGALTLVTLFAINLAFTSYYATMTDAAKREKIAPTSDKTEQHNADLLSLSQAAMPIDKAMAELASGRPAAITPQPSDDLGAVTGWSKLPHPAPVAAPHDAVQAADGGALGAAAGDAGTAMLGGDAGKPSTNANSPMKLDAGKH